MPEEGGEILKGPHNIPSNSDAGGHIGSECLAGEHSYFLAHWVRDRQDLTLPVRPRHQVASAVRHQRADFGVAPRHRASPPLRFKS